MVAKFQIDASAPRRAKGIMIYMNLTRNVRKSIFICQSTTSAVTNNWACGTSRKYENIKKRDKTRNK